MSEIIVALIGLIAAIAGGIITAVPTISKFHNVTEKNTAVMQFQLQELTKQVEKHNNVVERVFMLEQKTDTLFNYTENFRNDIRELSKSVKEIN